MDAQRTGRMTDFFGLQSARERTSYVPVLGEET